MTILGCCILMAMGASALHELSNIPKFEPGISEYVWFESQRPKYILDKEDNIKTESSTFLLDTTMETFQDREEKTLKLLMSLG